MVRGIDKDARALFGERQRWLDRRVLPAVHRLTWLTPRATTDFYHREACGYCDQARMCEDQGLDRVKG